jgi:hypothetical protein
MPHITGKASHHFEKASILLKIPSKRLYKSHNFSENIFKVPHFLKYKKASHSQKKKPRGNRRNATMASPPQQLPDSFL